MIKSVLDMHKSLDEIETAINVVFNPSVQNVEGLLKILRDAREEIDKIYASDESGTL